LPVFSGRFVALHLKEVRGTDLGAQQRIGAIKPRILCMSSKQAGGIVFGHPPDM
jgi:hypothetical protein